jgi:hypothetical protein
MQGKNMKCDEKLDKILCADDDTSLSFITRVQFFLHTFFCDRCRVVMEHYEDSRDLMKNDFFYDIPDLSDTIMNEILREETVLEDVENYEWVSFKKWIVGGCIILVSLVSAFFGFNFNAVAVSGDSSYMLSVGLVIGLIVSIYGSLFIGTQMKQLRHFLDHRD